jgi:hypothetical protein
VFSFQFACEVEGVTQDTIRSLAREDRLLDHDLLRCPSEETAADLRVFSLGVFAHNPEIDFAGQRTYGRDYPGKQTNRAQVDVLQTLFMLKRSRPKES